MSAHPFDSDGAGRCCACAGPAGDSVHAGGQRVRRVVLTLAAPAGTTEAELVMATIARYEGDQVIEVREAVVLP